MVKRYSIFPIQEQGLWDRYKLAESQFWVAEEIDLSQDKFESLNEKEQEVLKSILAFFTVSDGIVMENIATSLINEVSEPEAQFFYGYQIAIEQIHSIMYSLFIETYIKDESEKNKLFTPIESMVSVQKKADWALKWLGQGSFAEKLVAFSIVEGLGFSSLFSTVFYFRQGGKLPGFCQGNELIFRDENSHYEFALYYYKNYCKEKLSPSILREMILSALETEIIFANEVLGEGLIGLPVSDMITYLQFVTDTILEDYGLSKEFNVKQPLQYMSRILLDVRTNFFEQKDVNYTRVIPGNLTMVDF